MSAWWDFHKEDWISLFDRSADSAVRVRSDVSAYFESKRYKFSRLESDGSFELAKDWN